MEIARTRTLYEKIKEEYGSQCAACKDENEKCGNVHCSAHKGFIGKKARKCKK